MSLKKCTPCTSDVYVVSLMYKFEKIDNFRISLYFTTHASYDKYDASVMWILKILEYNLKRLKKKKTDNPYTISVFCLLI